MAKRVFNDERHRQRIANGVHLSLLARKPVTLPDVTKITSGMDRVKDVLDARLAARKRENSK